MKIDELFKGFYILCILHILNTDIVNSYNIYGNETGLNVIAGKNIGCEVNVVYEPPDDGLVKAETCVGVEE
jgi:hypothetical protein